MGKIPGLSFMIFAILLSSSLHSQTHSRFEFDQNKRLIKIKDFYCLNSKIFSASKGFDFFTGRGLNGAGTILSIEDVLELENIVDSLFNYTYSSDARVKDYLPRNYRKHYKRYRRQYLGFLDSSGNKLAAVQYINFKGTRAKKMYPDWDQNFAIGFGDWYEENTFILLVNITDRNIEIP